MQSLPTHASNYGCCGIPLTDEPYTETRDCVRLARSNSLTGDKDLTARFPIASFPEAVKRAQQAWPTIMPNEKGPNPSSAMPWLIDLMTPEPQKN